MSYGVKAQLAIKGTEGGVAGAAFWSRAQMHVLALAGVWPVCLQSQEKGRTMAVETGGGRCSGGSWCGGFLVTFVFSETWERAGDGEGGGDAGVLKKGL